MWGFYEHDREWAYALKVEHPLDIMSIFWAATLS